jgi:hypothetical protein
MRPLENVQFPSISKFNLGAEIERKGISFKDLTMIIPVIGGIY